MRAILAILAALALTSASGGVADASSPANANRLPPEVLVGYWQDFTNGSAVQRLRDVPKTFGVVNVAFATPAQPLDGSFTFSLDGKLSADILGGYTIAQFDHDVATLHRQGRLVLLSVGGQSRSFAIADDAMAERFATSAYREMQQHGFDGIDIDLENVITLENAPYLEKALRQLHGMIGPRLVVTLAPQPGDMSPATPERAAYLQLVRNLGDVVSMVNTQYYNSGTKLGRDGKVYANGTVEFITAQADDTLRFVDPSRLGIGVPSNPATRGYMAPEQVVRVLRCLKTGEDCGGYQPVKQYPTLRGAMIWSTNNDATNGYALSKAIAAQLSQAPRAGQ